MPNFEINFTGLTPVYETFQTNAKDKEDAFIEADTYIRDVYPELSEIEITEVKELNG